MKTANNNGKNHDNINSGNDNNDNNETWTTKNSNIVIIVKKKESARNENMLKVYIFIYPIYQREELFLHISVVTITMFPGTCLKSSN